MRGGAPGGDGGQGEGHPGAGFAQGGPSGQTFTFQFKGSSGGGGFNFRDPFEMFEQFFKGTGMGGGMGGMPGMGAHSAARRRQSGPSSQGEDLYVDAPKVTKLTRKNFGKTVGKRHRGDMTWLVEFYSPGCPHCRKAAPEIKKVAEKLDGIAKVGVVDCNSNEGSPICSHHGIQGVPSFKILSPQGSEDYDGPVNLRSLREAIVKTVPNYVTFHDFSISNVDTKLEELKRRCQGKHCAVLFTLKGEVSPMYRALARDLRTKQLDFQQIKVGRIKKDSPLAKIAQKMRGSGSILTVVDGSKSIIEMVSNARVYEGGMSYKPIKDWLHKRKK